jgi:hypothetical protein
LKKWSRTTRCGKHDLWKIGLKGELPGKAKWYSREKVEEFFSPHSVNIFGTKSLPKWGGMLQIG